MNKKTAPRIILDRKIIFSTTKQTRYIEIENQQQEKIILKWLEYYNQCDYVKYTPLFDHIVNTLQESDKIYYKILKNGDFKAVSKKLIGNNYIIPFTKSLTKRSEDNYNKSFSKNTVKLNDKSTDEPHDKFPIGLSLFTKDGRKTGNAVVVEVNGDRYIIVTDYGNIMSMAENEIERYFYEGRINKTHKEFMKYNKTTKEMCEYGVVEYTGTRTGSGSKKDKI